MHGALGAAAARENGGIVGGCARRTISAWHPARALLAAAQRGSWLLGNREGDRGIMPALPLALFPSVFACCGKVRNMGGHTGGEKLPIAPTSTF
jgi:hypothetical protein